MTRKKNRSTTVTTIALTDHHLRVLDQLVALGIFPSRSEAIRAAILMLEAKYLPRFGQYRYMQWTTGSA